MDAVGDEADGHAFVGEQRAGQAGVAMVERGHGVEEVRAIAYAGVETGFRFLIGCHAVPGAHHDAARRQGGDNFQRAGQLGGERDEAHAVLGRPVGHGVERWRAQVGGVVGALSAAG